MSNRPRLKDVARLAGVSTATVSAVVTNSVGANIRVSPETQQRVWDAVAQLGYVANPSARSLAGGKNKILGIFTYEPLFPFEYHDFFYPFLVGVEKEAEKHGYQIMLFTSGTNQNGERSIYHDDSNMLYMADGSILLGQRENKKELLHLQAEGYPFVFIGRRDLPGVEVSYVGCDYFGVTVELTTRLLDLGHKRLAYFGDPYLYESMDPQKRFEGSIDRENGFVEACKRRGLPADPGSLMRVSTESFTPEFMQRLIQSGITGACIELDDQCYMAMESLKKLGLSVPSDFSIVMLGEWHRIWENPIEVTMFTMPRREMGAQAARMLMKRLSSAADEGPESFSLPATIVEGKTMAPPRSV